VAGRSPSSFARSKRSRSCAAPAYLARAGSPLTPGDLEAHACIDLNAEGDSEQWPFDLGAGEPGRMRAARVRTRLGLNNAAAAIDAALRGQGIIQARSYQVAEHIAAGRLVRLLPQFEPPPIPAHIVFPPDRARRRAVRALMEYLAPALRRELLAIEALVPVQYLSRP
jgi:DNA-binding transcriptional LysR family regulator